MPLSLLRLYKNLDGTSRAVHYCNMFTCRVHFNIVNKGLTAKWHKFREKPMTTQAHQVLETAITTLHETTGLGARVLPEIGGQNRAADAIIEVETDGHKYRFAAEVKSV